MRKFFIGHDGRQVGPFAESDIPSMLKNGQIQAEALCWTEGMKQWQPLGEIFELATNPPPEPSPIVWNPKWAFHVGFGRVFKTVLDISPDGILLGNPGVSPRYPLHSITRVRWGGKQGETLDTEWCIAIGNEDSDWAVRFTRHDDVFATFIETLGQAVVIRLIHETLQTVGSTNRDLSFGDAILHDDGMTLHKFRLFKANEPVRFVWDEISTEDSNGDLVISGQRGKESASTNLSYRDQWNVHVLGLVIDWVKHSGARRLSDLL
jgi:hypothetical protein